MAHSKEQAILVLSIKKGRPDRAALFTFTSILQNG